MNAAIGGSWAHTDQETPSIVEILPQRSFLVVRIRGSGNDLIDATTANGHEAGAASSASSPFVPESLDTQADVHEYLDHHLLLSQGGVRLKGKLQSLQLFYPDAFDTSKTDFLAVYRYERAPKLADHSLQVSSILFNFLTKSSTIVSLGGKERVLESGETTSFDGSLTLPRVSDNVRDWFLEGITSPIHSFEAFWFLVALLCAVATLRWRALPIALLAFTLSQGVGLTFCLLTGHAYSARTISLGMALATVLMGVCAWWQARSLGQGRRLTENVCICLAIPAGFIFGLPTGVSFLEQGLPEVGLGLCIVGFIVGAFVGQLVLGGVGWFTLQKLRTKFDHDALYGGIPWTRALQWAAGAVGCLGGFWIVERLFQ